MSAVMQDAITHDTLAQEWRRRMVARGTIGALLLAVPVLAAAAIGFSAGAGGLPFGISSFASGPSGSSTSTGNPAQGPSISRLVGSASQATITPATAVGGGSGGGGAASAGGG